jgi:hypothetical protein
MQENVGFVSDKTVEVIITKDRKKQDVHANCPEREDNMPPLFISTSKTKNSQSKENNKNIRRAKREVIYTPTKLSSEQ